MFTKFNNIFIFETDTQSKTLITVVTWFSPIVPCQSKFFQYARCLATFALKWSDFVVLDSSNCDVLYRQL